MAAEATEDNLVSISTLGGEGSKAQSQVPRGDTSFPYKCRSHRKNAENAVESGRGKKREYGSV